MVEDTGSFTPEQWGELKAMFGRYSRTMAAQDAAAADNERVMLRARLAETNPLQPAPAQPAVDRRLGKTLEFWFASGTAALLYVTSLLEQPEFTSAVGRIGEAAMTDGSLDIGKAGAALIAAAVFLGRQYAKAKAAQGGAGA